MIYHGCQDAICFTDIKQAALYFDRVVSFGGIWNFAEVKTHDMHGGVDLTYYSEAHARALASITWGPDCLEPRLDNTAIVALDNFDSGLEMFVHKRHGLRTINDKHYRQQVNFREEATRMFLEDTYLPGIGRVREYISVMSLAKIDVTNFAALLPTAEAARDPAVCNSEDATAVLSNLMLVDTRNLTWEQIVELRRNPSARSKLRSLRLFLHTNYDGKPEAFIRDDICRRLADYESACKEHGLETKLAIISATLSSGNVLSALGTALSAAYFGGPITGATAAVTLELGQVTLTLAKQRASLMRIKDRHELSYVIQLRDSLRT